MVSFRGIEISQLTDNTSQKRLLQNNIKINVKQRFFVGLKFPSRKYQHGLFTKFKPNVKSSLKTQAAKLANNINAIDTI